MNKKILVVGLPVLLVAGSVYLFLLRKGLNTPLCLGENEVVDYTMDSRYAKEVRIPTVPVTIFIRSKSFNKVQRSFTIKNLFPLLRIHKCGIYVARKFGEGISNRREELWKFDYSGKGTKLFTLASFVGGKVAGTTYNSGFTVDPQEKYLTLERSYLGQPDYAGVIKDLNTLEDVFVLTLEDVKKINPAVEPGIIALGKWSNDSKFLWGTVFNGPIDTAYLRVDTDTWKTEIFSPPPDLSGAQALNTNGYIAYADFTTFYGIDIIARQAFEEFRREGREKHLYLYNFFTKERELIAAASDPEWHFKPKWLSDTELEYNMPSGERRVYKINQP